MKSYRDFQSNRITIDSSHYFLRREYEIACEEVQKYIRLGISSPYNVSSAYEHAKENLCNYLDENGYKMPAKMRAKVENNAML